MTGWGFFVIASVTKQSMGALVGVGADQAAGAVSGLPFDFDHDRPRRLPPPRNDGVVCVFVIASATKQSMRALAVKAESVFKIESLR